MKAARNFTFGDGKKTHRFAPGDDVPDKVIKALGKDSANNLILELAAKHNPDVLSREQLLELAGLDSDEVQEAVTEDFDEDKFREGMVEFSTKADLVEWAEGVLGIEGLDQSWNRTEIEDSIVSAYIEE